MTRPIQTLEHLSPAKVASEPDYSRARPVPQDGRFYGRRDRVTAAANCCVCGKRVWIGDEVLYSPLEQRVAHLRCGEELT